jgi:hypothetical protein
MLTLSDLYSSFEDRRGITTRAGLTSALIYMEGASFGAWFNILDHAMASGKTLALRDQIVIENAFCTPQWVAYLGYLDALPADTKILPRIDTAELAGDTKLGIAELKKQARKIREALAAAGQLAVVVVRIETLEAYKNLHDKLQSFQFGMDSFQELNAAANEMATDPAQERKLKNFLKLLRLLCSQISSDVSKLPASEGGWFAPLTEAAQRLDQAIQQKSADSFDALDDVRNVLRVVPQRLNERIVETTKDLRFDQLAAAVSATLPKLPDADPARPQISSAHGSIRVLQLTTTARVNEHGLWQAVDRKVANLMDLLVPPDAPLGPAVNGDPSLPYQFAPIWRALRPKVTELMALDPNGTWREKLLNYQTEIDSLLTRERVDTPFIGAFEDFRNESLQRFVEVDLALKQDCERLAEISVPLREILKELNP